MRFAENVIFNFSMSNKRQSKFWTHGILVVPVIVQDLIPPPNIHVQMRTLYTYTNTHMPRFSPSGFFGPSRCLILTPGLTPKYPILQCAVCVCVRAYTHLHPHTLPLALKIQNTQTSPLSLHLSKVITHAKQQVPSYTSWTPPSSFPNTELTNCTYMSAYAHPDASEYSNVYADV